MLKNKCSVSKRIKFPTFWYNCYYFTWSDTYFIQLETLLIIHPSYNRDVSTDFSNNLKYEILWKSVGLDSLCSMRTDGWAKLTMPVITTGNYFTKAPHNCLIIGMKVKLGVLLRMHSLKTRILWRCLYTKGWSNWVTGDYTARISMIHCIVMTMKPRIRRNGTWLGICKQYWWAQSVVLRPMRRPERRRGFHRQVPSIGHECTDLGSYGMVGLNNRRVQPPSSACHNPSFRRPVFVPRASLNGLFTWRISRRSLLIGR